jgi:hypothetical protein
MAKKAVPLLIFLVLLFVAAGAHHPQADEQLGVLRKQVWLPVYTTWKFKNAPQVLHWLKLLIGPRSVHHSFSHLFYIN